MSETITPEIETRHLTLNVADGTEMPAYLAQPVGAGPHPGVLVIQEIFGVNPHIRDLTERYARAGYTAIAPALFHRTDPNFESGYTDMSVVMPHLKAITDANLIADVTSAHEWLVSNEGGKAAKVGIVGYCMGGRVVFLANTALPLDAAISYYGGGIAPNGIFPSLLDKAADLHAPILMFWGGKDGHITLENRRAVEDALMAAGKPTVQAVFSEADHGFNCDQRDSFNPDASRQAQIGRAHV